MLTSEMRKQEKKHKEVKKTKVIAKGKGKPKTVEKIKETTLAARTSATKEATADKESKGGSVVPDTGRTVGSSSLNEHPDEARVRSVGQPMHTSTPAKDGSRSERVSRDQHGLPGNVVKAGSEISRGKLCHLRDMEPVPGAVVWGTSVLERQTKYLIRRVYLYRNSENWLMVVAKGEGDLPRSMRIEEDPYDLLICKKSSEVRFGMGWVTVHDSKRPTAWLVHADKGRGGTTLSTTPGSSTNFGRVTTNRTNH